MNEQLKFYRLLRQEEIIKQKVAHHKKEIQRIFEKRRDVYSIMKGLKDPVEFAKLHNATRWLDRQVTINAFAIARLERQKREVGK